MNQSVPTQSTPALQASDTSIQPIAPLAAAAHPQHRAPVISTAGTVGSAEAPTTDLSAMVPPAPITTFPAHTLGEMPGHAMPASPHSSLIVMPAVSAAAEQHLKEIEARVAHAVASEAKTPEGAALITDLQVSLHDDPAVGLVVTFSRIAAAAGASHAELPRLKDNGDVLKMELLKALHHEPALAGAFKGADAVTVAPGSTDESITLHVPLHIPQAKLIQSLAAGKAMHAEHSLAHASADNPITHPVAPGVGGVTPPAPTHGIEHAQTPPHAENTHAAAAVHGASTSHANATVHAETPAKEAPAAKPMDPYSGASHPTTGMNTPGAADAPLTTMQTPPALHTQGVGASNDNHQALGRAG